VSLYVHAYTLYGSIRPFGVSSLLGSFDKAEGPQLYVIDPSGVSFVSFYLFTQFLKKQLSVLAYVSIFALNS